MVRTIRFVTLVEIEDGVDHNDINDWIGGHMDNIPEEILEEMEIDPSKVTVGITYPDGEEV